MTSTSRPRLYSALSDIGLSVRIQGKLDMNGITTVGRLVCQNLEQVVAVVGPEDAADIQLALESHGLTLRHA